MVKDILIDILTTQKDRLSGEDVKNIVESIQLIESLERKNDDKAKSPEQIVKDWLGE